MPLTAKGQEMKNAMQKEYGSEKGTSVFYASKNKGTITGVEATFGNSVSAGTGEDRKAAVREAAKKYLGGK
jgi:hypothetical protein